MRRTGAKQYVQYIQEIKNFSGQLVLLEGEFIDGHKIWYYNHIIDDIVVEEHKTLEYFLKKYDVQFSDELRKNIINYVTKFADDIVQESVDRNYSYCFALCFWEDLINHEDFYDMINPFIEDNYRDDTSIVWDEIEKKVYEITKPIIIAAQDKVYELVPEEEYY